MLVRTISEITNTDRDVVAPTNAFRSKRILLAKDKAGFSLHETTVQAGTVNDFWYANHIEACYIISGEGEIWDRTNDKIHSLGPGSTYLLDGHEKHQVRARTEMKMICIFNPPVTGREVHDEDGTYPLVLEEE